jgi:hypothetical protein
VLGAAACLPAIGVHVTSSDEHITAIPERLVSVGLLLALCSDKLPLAEALGTRPRETASVFL